MRTLATLACAVAFLGVAPARADIPPPSGCEDRCNPSQIAAAGTVCTYCADYVPPGDAGITYYEDGGSPRCRYYPAPPFRYVCSHWVDSTLGWKEVWCDGPVQGADDAGSIPLACPPDAGTDAPGGGGGASCLVGGGAARTIGPWALASGVALLLILLGRRRRR
jgi:hypothetical protein